MVAEAQDETPPVPVELATATAKDMPNYFNATGSLEAKRRVELIAKVGGQVEKIAFESFNIFSWQV